MRSKTLEFRKTWFDSQYQIYYLNQVVGHRSKAFFTETETNLDILTLSYYKKLYQIAKFNHQLSERLLLEWWKIVAGESECNDDKGRLEKLSIISWNLDNIVREGEEAYQNLLGKFPNSKLLLR